MDGRSLSDARSRFNHSLLPVSCAQLRLPRLDLHKVPLQVYNMSTASERDNAALIRFVLPLTPAEVDCTMARFIKKGHERKGLHSDVRSKGWIPGRDSGQGGRRVLREPFARALPSRSPLTLTFKGASN